MIFDTIKSELKKTLSESDYKRYIQTLIFNENESKSDLIVFEVTNLLVANWIKTKYSSKIADLYEIYTKIRPQIEINIRSKKNNPIIEKTKENILIQTKPTTKTILNSSYTFESFVVGSSNQYAYSVAMGVVDKPDGQTYNPLFIYGGTGLGKTHLLQAIGNEYKKLNKTIIYSTIEQFMNDFTYHLRNKTPDRFRDKYRECDLLLIDDIQFLSGKEETQKEFFHTFNELHSQNKQIVITADKNPKQIAGLEDRLKSRFLWGQVANIQPPELETKIAIIKKKCEIDQIYLDNEIVQYIATNMNESIREIEGTLIKLNTYSQMMNQKLSLNFVKDVLKEQIKETKENITIEYIIKTVSSEMNIKPNEIKSKSRVKNIVQARRMVIYLTRKLTQNSMPAIANYFSMKDHTAVSHAMKKISQIMGEDADFKMKIDELSNKILTKND